MDESRKPVRLLRLGLTDSWRTQAVYHAVAEAMQEESPDTLILCRPRQPYLCLGYHQVYDAVLDRKQCLEREVAVFRRQLGGGTTYLDSDQVFYQCVFHHSRVPVLFQEIYQRMLRAPVAALRQLGLNAELREVNEIEVDGRRIAGTGGGRIREACVVVGNLLLDFDYQALPRFWRTPWESFRELAAQALRERIVTLRRLTGNLAAETVEPLLLGAFAAAFGRPLEEGTLTREEERRSQKIAARMASPGYLDLHRGGGPILPMDSLKISANVFIRADQTQVDGHRIRGSFRVRGTTIEESRLESCAARSWLPLDAALEGTEFDSWMSRLPALAG